MDTLTLTFGSLQLTVTSDDAAPTQPTQEAPKVGPAKAVSPKVSTPKAARVARSAKPKTDARQLLKDIRQATAEGRFSEALKLAQDRGWAQEVTAIEKRMARSTTQEAPKVQRTTKAPTKSVSKRTAPKEKTVGEKLTAGVAKAAAKRAAAAQDHSTEPEPKRVTAKPTAAKLDAVAVAEGKAKDAVAVKGKGMLADKTLGQQRRDLDAKVAKCIDAGIDEDMVDMYVELVELTEALDEAADAATQDGESAAAAVLTSKAVMFAEATAKLLKATEAAKV